jgi:anoctamin-1
MRFGDDQIHEIGNGAPHDHRGETFNVQRTPLVEVDSPSDYPENPYGDRINKIESLFFSDGKRSIDFVLCWKKLIVHDDDDSKDIEAVNEITKKEAERAAKREVFEENLINEGLEIERVTVDDEINFVKVHAPLEVLRRYAEILKLRLPMKEVSQIKCQYN